MAEDRRASAPRSGLRRDSATMSQFGSAVRRSKIACPIPLNPPTPTVCLRARPGFAFPARRLGHANGRPDSGRTLLHERKLDCYVG
jgi:hypothetical protein